MLRPLEGISLLRWIRHILGMLIAFALQLIDTPSTFWPFIFSFLPLISSLFSFVSMDYHSKHAHRVFYRFKTLNMPQIKFIQLLLPILPSPPLHCNTMNSILKQPIAPVRNLASLSSSPFLHSNSPSSHSFCLIST